MLIRITCLITGLLFFSSSTTLAQNLTNELNTPVMLSTLGARLTVVPEPQKNTIRILPLGFNLPELSGLSVQMTAGNHPLSFPPNPENQSTNATVETSPVSILYSMKDAKSQCRLNYELISPITPILDKWRTAPVMILKLTVINEGNSKTDVQLNCLPFDRPAKTIQKDGVNIVQTIFPLQMDPSILESENVLNFISPHLQGLAESKPDAGGSFSLPDSMELAAGCNSSKWQRNESGFISTFNLAPLETQTRFIVLTSFCPSPVMLVDKKPATMAYTQDFSNACEITQESLDTLDALLRRSNQFATLCRNHSDPLFTLALHSFLSNTWLLRLPDGSTRYTEWEGAPLFHCTLDVVMNTAPFHILFTPDFLKDMLIHWPDYFHQNHMPHDMGRGLIIEKNSYPVQMAIEEDTNYILLLHLYGSFTGDWTPAQQHAGILEKLIRNILDSDTDDDGLPNTGTINTFDDAPSVINANENQLYLGVKCAEALESWLEIPLILKNTTLITRTQKRIKKIYSTIENSWTGDHFPICKQASKVKKSLIPMLQTNHSSSQEDLYSAEVSCDGWSNYLFHGWVTRFITGHVPPDAFKEKMRRHMISAHQKTATIYGDAHCNGIRNVWVSQNMWRDLAGLYLNSNPDLMEMKQKYWALQLKTRKHQTNPMAWQGFCDSPFNAYLTAYSRGIPMILYPWAKEKFSLDASKGTIHVELDSSRSPVPLPFFADWNSGEIPHIVWNQDNRWQIQTVESAIHRGFKLIVTQTEHK